MNGPHHNVRGQLLNATLGTLAAALLVSGCTTHYRESLAAYRSAEPSPFYQRTLEWAGKAADTAKPAEVMEPSTPAESPPDLEPRPDTPDKQTEVAARVLGVIPAFFMEQSAVFATDSDREARLADGLAWDELMLVVALQSPEVAAARSAWEATLNQYSQGEFLEGLLQEYKTFTRFLDVGAGEALQKDMTQSFFPNPGTMAYRGEMVREQVRLAELAWERRLRDTLVEAGSLFFDYQFQFQGAVTVDENVKLLENLIGVVQDRYATGLASQPDVLRLQGELERQRNLLQDFKARQRSTAAMLNALLGRPAGAPLGRPAAKELPYHAPAIETFTDAAFSRRQEVLEQESRVARMEIAIRMGELMNRPLFTQGYSTFDRGMMPDASTGAPAMPFGADADPASPRPAYAQSEAYLAEMRQRLEGERAMLRQRKLDTEALARTSLEQADIAHRQALLIRDVVLPLDQSTYDITLRAYTVGELTFIDLLDAERKLTATRLELDESRRDRNQAVLRIATVRGTIE